jgi:hypothetical protein
MPVLIILCLCMRERKSEVLFQSEMLYHNILFILLQGEILKRQSIQDQFHLNPFCFSSRTASVMIFK